MLCRTTATATTTTTGSPGYPSGMGSPRASAGVPHPTHPAGITVTGYQQEAPTDNAARDASAALDSALQVPALFGAFAKLRPSDHTCAWSKCVSYAQGFKLTLAASSGGYPRWGLEKPCRLAVQFSIFEKIEFILPHQWHPIYSCMCLANMHLTPAIRNGGRCLQLMAKALPEEVWPAELNAYHELCQRQARHAIRKILKNLDKYPTPDAWAAALTQITNKLDAYKNNPPAGGQWTEEQLEQVELPDRLFEPIRHSSAVPMPTAPALEYTDLARAHAETLEAPQAIVTAPQTGRAHPPARSRPAVFNAIEALLSGRHVRQRNSSAGLALSLCANYPQAFHILLLGTAHGKTNPLSDSPGIRTEAVYRILATMDEIPRYAQEKSILACMMLINFHLPRSTHHLDARFNLLADALPSGNSGEEWPPELRDFRVLCIQQAWRHIHLLRSEQYRRDQPLNKRAGVPLPNRVRRALNRIATKLNAHAGQDAFYHLPEAMVPPPYTIEQLKSPLLLPPDFLARFRAGRQPSTRQEQAQASVLWARPAWRTPGRNAPGLPMPGEAAPARALAPAIAWGPIELVAAAVQANPTILISDGMGRFLNAFLWAGDNAERMRCLQQQSTATHVELLRLVFWLMAAGVAREMAECSPHIPELQAAYDDLLRQY
ncbi:hypothetical protein SOM08_15940 [Hydrogenophaga sp. SNF1]|uniref:hypothetical protein n=1 Tax=Hydrogenophaga sp. SNF1 TaxID=3098762 RepID=UPI002ACC189B|nr:hypothetical protein [Hydrogenophaga sp. SNF1]WQB82481.1 hypothetical protein SOM08_15940 [Hydrogenophaga sp. SNF1]